MAFTEKPPAMPDPVDYPLVDPRTGKMTEAWRLWFRNFIAWLGRGFAAIP